MRDDDLRDYHAELKQEYDALERDSAYHDKMYKRDFIDYDAAKVNKPLRDKAYRVAQQVGRALMIGKFADLHAMKMDLLRLIGQVNYHRLKPVACGGHVTVSI